MGPLAPETCNARDDNCNGRADFAVVPGDYEDDDGDGHADTACGGDDCDDRDFTTFPSAGDWIDGRDNDCDGEVDEGVDIVFYRDADNDGFGDVATTRVATRTPVGYVAVAGDCADDDAMRAPSASEVCDGGDNDCDAKTDEGLLVVFCPDGDGDGFGGSSAGCSMACPDAPPADTGVGSLDCADGDQDVYPNAPEICDTVDNDCDGVADCPLCGDSTCDLSLGETPIACNADCASMCPDTYCSQGESTGSCATDCLCDVNERVAANRCVACTGGTTNEAGDDASGADTSCSDACQVALGVSCAVFAEAYVKAPSPFISDLFGQAVALDGDTLVVGAPWEDSQVGGATGNQSSLNSGTVYVFVRSGTVWSQQALLKSVTIAAVTEFGGSVAISGDTLAVGGSTGRVEVFTRSGSSWSRQAQLVGQFSEAVDTFGSSLALEGDTLVIGAEREGSAAAGVDGDQTNNDAPTSGAAYVFVRSGITWTQQAYLKATNPGSGDNFGSAVAISGDTVVVGAPLEDSDGMGVGTNGLNDNTMTSGAAYVFVRTAGVWSPQALLKASNTGASDRFGSSVAISGETLVVGAQGESSGASGVGGDQLNDSATGSGAAYVFVRVTNAWSQQAYIKASNTGMSDAFGGTVTLSGDVLVVAASAEDSNARNVNGLESDNSAEAGGAVYLFRRTGSVWAQVAYIKASNTGGGDYFGSSLSLSGNTLVVGAFLEDGGFGGVNGNQSDNSRGGAGAAYVRRLAP